MSHDDSSNCPRLPDGTLLEGIVTTLNEDGSPHIAPMGPIVDADFGRLLLRPFRTSTTYQNLKRIRQGVLHVTDDVELFARAAVGQLRELPRLLPATAIEGVILENSCRWYAFRVTSINDHEERTEIIGETIDRGTRREFFGFNRAKHAVIEAAILATRIEFLDRADVLNEFERLNSAIAKTGGHQERGAFEFLKTYVLDQYAQRRAAETAGR